MWKCASCSESLEDQFDACWSCGAAKPGSVGSPPAEADRSPAASPGAMRRARQPGEVGFKQTADGRHLFFPYGVFSKGRLIDSEATYQRLLSHQKRWFLFGVITAIVMARLPAEGFVICLGLFAAVHYLFTNRITSKLHVVDERPTLDDLRDGLSGFFAGTFTTVLLFILGALFTLGGVLLLFLSKDGMAGPLGVTGLGVGLIVLSWMGGGNARDGAP